MAKPAKDPTKPARTAAKAAISAKPTPCKMSKTGLPLDYRVNAEDMPVTIKLCDAKGAPSVVLQFVSVDASGAPMSPKANTCALNLKKGSYNVNIVIGPAAGADPSTKPTAYVYEACDNPFQLCFIDTKVGPGGSFALEVVAS